MNFILGKKIGMTQIFTESGRLIPVTKVEVQVNTVLRVKTKETDGYEAVVLASGNRNKIKKSLLGLFKKFGKFRYVKEFRTDGANLSLKSGDKIGLNSFNIGDKVKVSAISKGKGFQGVVKRHGFHGTNEQHGNKDQSRMPGSIGATGPAHVFKGTRMAGRTGGNQITVVNLEIVKIDLDHNFLYLKGSFAGATNTLVSIKGDGEFKEFKEDKEENAKQTEITIKKDENAEVAEVKEEEKSTNDEKESREIKEDKKIKTENETENKKNEEKTKITENEVKSEETKIRMKENDKKNQKEEDDKKEDKKNDSLINDDSVNLDDKK